MRKYKLAVLISAVGAISAAPFNSASASILYNPVVVQVGDGSTTAGGLGYTTTDEIFAANVANQTSPIASNSYNGVGSGLITTSSTVEGALSNNPAVADAAAAGTQFQGTYYVYNAGYTGADGASSTVGRTVGYMTVTPNSLSPAGANVVASFATNRGATGDNSASNFWVSGSTTGYSYFTSTPTQLATAPANTRTIQIRNGQLYGSSDTGSTFVGITVIGTGTPTTSGQTTTALFNSGLGNAGNGSSSQVAPSQFVLIDDPAQPASPSGYNVVYLADQGNSGNNTAKIGGIQKWVWSSATSTNNGWSLDYMISDGTNNDSGTNVGGYMGLAGQLDTTSGSVYLWATTASTAAGNLLEQFTDPLEATAVGPNNDSEITLAAAAANDFFRGVALAPAAVPEPTSLGLFALAAVGLLGRRKRAN